MRALLDFLKKYNYWFLFFLLEGISLGMLFRFNAYQRSIWFTTANTLSGVMMEKWSDVVAYVNLGELNQELTQKNIALEQELGLLRSKFTTDSKGEGGICQGDVLADFRLIEAKVVDASLFKKNNYVTVNRGEKDGIRPEMGVVSGTGVVGIVYATSENFALVMPLLHEKSNISCQLRGTGYFGYLEWDGGSPTIALLVDIPRHAKVEKGMIVETSGFSAVFPAGLQIGKVVHVDDSEDGLSYRLQVELSVDFSNLRDVCLMQSANSNEIEVLQNLVNEEK